uniref:L-ascorbate peroxidase n=1 Tax=Kalanchoe fedtschenkoi TaxID=63787 RepID=A0A7N0U0E4_KALFE
MAEPLSLISSLTSFSPTPLAGAVPATSAFPKSRVVAVSASHKCLPLRSFPSPSSIFLHKRRSAIHVSSTNFSSLSPKCFASDPAQLKGARDDIKELLRTKFCHPILVRLGWHDAGTYDKSIEDWPQRGGANGSLRFEVELKHAANAGLLNALTLIQPIKDKYPGITYADLFQLASATAIEETGGPKIPMIYGRVDVSSPEQCPPEGKLPDAGPPSPAEHLRQVFYRMGLNDKDIVALSGAHTLGRARPERSGWGKPETKYTVLKMALELLVASLGRCSGSSLIILTSRTSEKEKMKICWSYRQMQHFLMIHHLRCMLRNMLKTRKPFLQIMLNLMLN